MAKSSRRRLSLPPGVGPGDVRAQLERVLSSDTFSRSQRLSSFLLFVVEKGLAGELHELKEMTVALEVFDRPADFEPKLDPIVRVEAGRLRSKIREYYDTVGVDDPLWVGLAARGYRPVVRERLGAAPKPKPERKAMPTPEPLSLAVLPIEDLSAGGALRQEAIALTDRLIHSLALNGKWEVAARTSIRQYRQEPDDAREIGAQVNVSWLLEGSLQQSRELLRLQLRLVAADSGLATWAATYEAPAEPPADAQDAFARKTVEALAERADQLAAE